MASVTEYFCKYNLCVQQASVSQTKMYLSLLDEKKSFAVPRFNAESLLSLQWDSIQDLLGHPVEKPVVLHR